MKKLSVSLMLFLTVPVFADSYVECQKDGKFELALTSEKVSDYAGPVGKTWELKLVSLDRDWITWSDQIYATNYLEYGKHVVEVTIGRAIKYKVTDVLSESPGLEKVISPNEAQPLRFGEFTCFAVNR